MAVVTSPTPPEDRPIILVTGATGNQGGAVVDALIDSGNWAVRALTRSPTGAPARALAARGVEVTAGDLADAESLRPALTGVHGVFSVQNSRTAGLAGEVRQGRTLIDVAASAGVRHLVYSSVGGVERVRGIPHFDTKWRIERHLRDSTVDWTILRPTTFTEVFTIRGASIGLSMMAATLGTDKTLQMIAVPDIGVFARLAFERPGEHVGRAVELAGDELTVPQIAETLRGSGRRIRLARLPKSLLKLMGPESRMLLWFGESGYAADIAALRREHPELLTLRRWLAVPVRGGSAQQVG
jgi:uncharacterized protein YbjT (DUF2867 family)